PYLSRSLKNIISSSVILSPINRTKDLAKRDNSAQKNLSLRAFCRGDLYGRPLSRQRVRLWRIPWEFN
ncbi:hypothetical protein KJ637_03535, partial [Patescibacteria group bacterium]|nr:hypothetical protein [Patescibacteria group bacterium]